jgi:hypothetical protein
VRHRKRIIRAPIVNILYLWRNLKKVLENELAYYRITCKTCAPIVLSPKYDGWHDRCGSFHSVWLPLERWNADCTHCGIVRRVSLQLLPDWDLKRVVIWYFRYPGIVELTFHNMSEQLAYIYLYSKGR